MEQNRLNRTIAEGKPGGRIRQPRGGPGETGSDIEGKQWGWGGGRFSVAKLTSQAFQTAGL